MNAPKMIDLFSGCGGISLGATRAGFELAVAIDTDERALSAHARNFPNAKHLSLDLSKTSGQQILDAAGLKQGEIDMVVGGPPCQGFSSIGKRDITDSRNQRLGDFFRLVNEIKPKAFVVENVPGILSSRYTHIVNAARSLARDSYHILDPHRIKAVDAGAPTIRTRVVIVGFLKEKIIPPSDFWANLPNSRNIPPVIRCALDGLPFDVNPDPSLSRGGKRTVRVSQKGAFFLSVTGNVPPGVGDQVALNDYLGKHIVTGCIGTRHSAEIERRYEALAYGEVDSTSKAVRLDPNGYCPTLRAGTGPDKGSYQAVRPIHYLRPRVITPREAARLQGFPDWFQFDETKWHSFRQLGNSVSPLVAEFVMKKMANTLGC